MQPTTTERELPMLAGIGAFVTWCEELLAILSGPILTFGLAIALVALLTDGALLVRIPALLYVWAASQAIGLDAQFIGSAAKLARAIRQRRGWPIVGYIILCGALGYVGYVASNVFATQEANGITTAEALARLGMDSTSWIVQRSLLAVALVFLSGFLRYVAPHKDAALSAEEERAQLQRDLELEPLRQQLRAQQLRGVRGAVNALRGKEDDAIGRGSLAPAVSPVADPLPPVQFAPPGSAPLPPFDQPEPPDPDDDPPPSSSRARKGTRGQVVSALPGSSYDPASDGYTGNGHTPSNVTRIRGARRGHKRVVREGREARKVRQRNEAYGILDEDPNISIAALKEKVGCGWKQAKRFQQDWLSWREQQRAAAK